MGKYMIRRSIDKTLNRSTFIGLEEGLAQRESDSFTKGLLVGSIRRTLIERRKVNDFTSYPLELVMTNIESDVYSDHSNFNAHFAYTLGSMLGQDTPINNTGPLINPILEELNIAEEAIV